ARPAPDRPSPAPRRARHQPSGPAGDGASRPTLSVPPSRAAGRATRPAPARPIVLDSPGPPPYTRRALAHGFAHQRPDHSSFPAFRGPCFMPHQPRVRTLGVGLLAMGV